MIPENAPFPAEQRAWLNGFFAGLLSSDSQSGTALPAQESAALASALAPQSELPGLEDDGAPGTIKHYRLPTDEACRRPPVAAPHDGGDGAARLRSMRL